MVHKIIIKADYMSQVDDYTSLIGKKSADVHRQTDNNKVLQDRSFMGLDAVGDNNPPASS